MAALTSNIVNGQGRAEGRSLPVLIKSGKQVYVGGLYPVDDTGLTTVWSGTNNALAATTSAGLRLMGVVSQAANSGLGDGSAIAIVERRGTWVFQRNGGSAAAADLGKLAYCVDEQTVDTVTSHAGVAANVLTVGKIIRIVDANTVEVDLQDKTL